MTKNKKHKELIKQIKQNNKCTVSPQDIYMKTDFFDREHIKNKSPYKLAFIFSLMLLFVSITFISILGVQNYKLSTKEPEVVYIEKIHYMIDDTNGMPLEEKLNIKEELDFFSYSPICTYSHEKNIIIYIYNGYKINEENRKIHYYYYTFKLFNYSKEVIVTVNEKTLSVSDTNRHGLLTIIDESKTNDLVFSFTVESENMTKKYILDASNY